MVLFSLLSYTIVKIYEFHFYYNSMIVNECFIRSLDAGYSLLRFRKNTRHQLLMFVRSGLELNNNTYSWKDLSDIVFDGSENIASWVSRIDVRSSLGCKIGKIGRLFSFEVIEVLYVQIEAH